MTNISNQTMVPYQEHTYPKKKLQDLNLMDAFLFDVSTEKPEDAQVIARTIIKRVMGHELQEITVESQKQFFALDLGKRGIRMDLWVREKIGFIRQRPMQKNYPQAQSLRSSRILS